MIFENNIFEMDENEIIKINYKKIPFIKRITIINEKKFKLENIMRERGLYRNSTFLIAGEDVYIKYLTIPKVDKNSMEKIIRDELNNYYKAKDEICFSYKVISTSENSIRIIVFYIDSEVFTKMKLKIESEAKAAYLVQFCYMKNLNKIITENYILIFKYNMKVYYIFCEKGILKANLVIKKSIESSEEIEAGLQNFIKINRSIITKSPKLFIQGFSNEIIEKSNINSKFEILDSINKKEIYNMIV